MVLFRFSGTKRKFLSLGVRRRRARAMSSTERMELSSSMWTHARSVDPGFPSERLRAADLRHHQQLAERLRRVAHVFAGR